MDIVVDLNTAKVVMRHPEDLQRFAVRVLPAQEGDGAGTDALGALAAALSIHNAGRIDPTGEAFVPPDAVRRLAMAAAEQAGGVLGPEWDTGFASMLEYAASKGWIDGEGDIQAHVEWDPA